MKNISNIAYLAILPEIVREILIQNQTRIKSWIIKNDDFFCVLKLWTLLGFVNNYDYKEKSVIYILI